MRRYATILVHPIGDLVSIPITVLDRYQRTCFRVGGPVQRDRGCDGQPVCLHGGLQGSFDQLSLRCGEISASAFSLFNPNSPFDRKI
jgi:hypothetical protein